jgi:hypothetical protein
LVGSEEGIGLVVDLEVSGEKIYLAGGKKIFSISGEEIIETEADIRRIWVDEKENIYLTDGKDYVNKYDCLGKLLWRFGGFGGEGKYFDGAMGIWADGEGRVYVADLGNERIKIFVEKEEEKVTFAPPLSFMANGEEELRIEGVKIYPNPFSLSGKMRYMVVEYRLSCVAEEVELRIYTLAGRLVRVVRGFGQKGVNYFYWSGRNGRGEQVSRGMYIYKLVVRNGGRVISRTGQIGVK